MNKYIFLMLFFLSASFSLYAESDEELPRDDDTFQNIIIADEDVPTSELEAVFLSEDFGKTARRWRIKFKQENDGKKKNKIDIPAPWVKIWNLITANALRALTLLLVTAAIVIVIILYRKMEFRPFTRKKTKAHFKREEAGDRAGELLKAAKMYYQNGKLREAWLSLYKAALGAFKEKNIAHPLNATEYECLSLVQIKAPGYAGQFKQLIYNRIAIAYRSIIPPDAEFNAAFNFCRTLASDKEKEEDER
jgi:hypothetical protein